jgi:hypothetical protein
VGCDGGEAVNVALSEAEREAIETLAQSLPEPGTRCPTCHRRVNKPRKEGSPPVREVRFRGPADLVDDVEEHLDVLQEYAGIDPYSYPRLTLVSALLALGARHREELSEHFQGEA